MKKSTKAYWLGMFVFFAGSIVVQMYIDTLLFVGITAIAIGWMLINAHVDYQRHEENIDELNSLLAKIEETIKGCRKLGRAIRLQSF